jgi:hypothetical protein
MDWVRDREADHLFAKCDDSHSLSERWPSVTLLCNVLAGAHPCMHLLVTSPEEWQNNIAETPVDNLFT